MAVTTPCNSSGTGRRARGVGGTSHPSALRGPPAALCPSRGRGSIVPSWLFVRDIDALGSWGKGRWQRFVTLLQLFCKSEIM